VVGTGIAAKAQMDEQIPKRPAVESCRPAKRAAPCRSRAAQRPRMQADPSCLQRQQARWTGTNCKKRGLRRGCQAGKRADQSAKVRLPGLFAGDGFRPAARPRARMGGRAGVQVFVQRRGATFLLVAGCGAGGRSPHSGCRAGTRRPGTAGCASSALHWDGGASTDADPPPQPFPMDWDRQQREGTKREVRIRRVPR